MKPRHYSVTELQQGCHADHTHIVQAATTSRHVTCSSIQPRCHCMSLETIQIIWEQIICNILSPGLNMYELISKTFPSAKPSSCCCCCYP